MLTRIESQGIAYHSDRELRQRAGVVIAFSERVGGVSPEPYATLNLAGHVGDDASLVNENRARLLDAVGVREYGGALTTAEQVHGVRIERVGTKNAGYGANVGVDPGPVPGADALWTTEAGVPLMLFFADCVPVVLVSELPRAVAVVHAGWRGAYGGIVGHTVRELRRALDDPEIVAYIGPHIGECCYEVAPSLVSQFADVFGAITRTADRLDLAAAVAEDLDRAGVPSERQSHFGICTAHNVDRFYSYRMEGRTGRQCALAVLEPRV